MSNFFNSLYILEIRPLSDVGLVKIFSHSVSCFFVLLTVSFALQKLFSFERSYLFTGVLSVCATGVTFRKWSPVPMRLSVLPIFFSVKFSMIEYILRSLIHLNLRFMHGDRYGYIFILLHVDTQFFQQHLLKMLYFFHCIILAFSSRIRCS